MSIYVAYSVIGEILYRFESLNFDKAAFEADTGDMTVPATIDVSSQTHYVTNGQVVEKQPLNLPESLQVIADGDDESVITGIPTGVTVEWPDGQTDEVTDGEVRFSVDLPGTYTLTFDAVPYLRQEVTIEAVPAT